MKVSQAIEKLNKVVDLNDFQELFFDYENEPMFTIEYKKSEKYFTSNPTAKVFDKNGSCINSYMKFEDGRLQYPF